MDVWLNGQFVPMDEARISAFDAGVQHAVGLFETLAARNGRPFRAPAHVERMAESARALGLTQRLRVDPLQEAIEATLARSGMTEARIRVTITGGNLNLLAMEPGGKVDPTILIVAQPVTQYPDAFFADGVSVTIADGRLNPFDPTAGHKTINYWPRLRALSQAATVGAGEAVWFSISNHLAAGSVSNILLVKDEEVLTPIAQGEEQTVARQASDSGGGSSGSDSSGGDAPAIPSPVLPGITRAAVLELAEERGLAVRRRMLDINDLLGADEVMLTNSSWGVLPVVQVEKEKIASGSVGEHTHALRQAWLDLVEAETRG